ncbi:ketopantoate reductase family protein [Rhizobacter sp. Root1221]|uniref:ketopantoate reductase family protein n=1 Tax=Rhizobacter sp. Root1221 TaxID=1736433 RepID=UPI0006F5EE36|nr:2-dehydropantoate 2-reductase [Rhizobacter sp. Root1221]KQV96933.1 hypothetical protein ASC87_23965 [Rhizobacter sp. Root1221]
MNRICIFGAGAVGGHMAAWLARAGLDVSVVARGPHLDAIRANGLRYVSDAEDFTVRVAASADARDLGPQDLVISAVKAHTLPHVVDGMQPLLGPETPVVFATNGVPWWYFHGLPEGADQPSASERLKRLDPGGRLWQGLGARRAIGCVVTSPNELSAPGVVRNNATTNTFVIGEPDNTMSARLRAIETLLRQGLSGVSATTAIRDVVWSKLMLNITTSTLGALTMRPPIEFAHDEPMLAVYRPLLAEGVRVAASLGVQVAADEEARIARMRTVRHPPSMLQDLMAGRPLEIDAQLLAVQDLARQGGVATPVLDILLALLVQRMQAGG